MYGVTAEREIVDKGADIHAKDEYQKTPLHRLAENRNFSEHALLFGKFLIEKGANIRAAAKDGATPLHLAITGGNVGFTLPGEIVGESASFEGTPLHELIKHNRTRAAKIDPATGTNRPD